MERNAQYQSIAYGGRTSCGYPACAPDPDLVRQLDAATDVLEALEEMVRDWHGRPDLLTEAQAAIKKARA